MAAKLKLRAQHCARWRGVHCHVARKPARSLLLIENGNRGVGAYDFRGGPPFRSGSLCA